jgi:hypothetical protein
VVTGTVVGGTVVLPVELELLELLEPVELAVKLDVLIDELDDDVLIDDDELDVLIELDVLTELDELDEDGFVGLGVAVVELDDVLAELEDELADVLGGGVGATVGGGGKVLGAGVGACVRVGGGVGASPVELELVELHPLHGYPDELEELAEDAALYCSVVACFPDELDDVSFP